MKVIVENSQTMDGADDVVAWINDLIGHKPNILWLFEKSGTDKTRKLGTNDWQELLGYLS